MHRYTASNGREIVKIPIVKSGYLCSERERERELNIEPIEISNLLLL